METFTRRLSAHFPDKIKNIEILRQNGKYLPGYEIGEMLETTDLVVNDVKRFGKFIAFYMPGGYMLCHNAMSGYWDSREEPWTFDYVEGKREAKADDVRVEIELLKNGTLRFHDARLFGSLRFRKSSCTPLDVRSRQDLGPDALCTPMSGWPDSSFTKDDLWNACVKRPQKTIKELLTDQRVVAGIGNIYSSEILWHACIDPRDLAGTLSSVDVGKIVEETQRVLQQALELDLRYDKYLMVYRQKECVCGEPIVNVKIAGRSTYFCENCQE